MKSLPRVCGVVGGGQMGAGIAHSLLLSGADVVLLERDEEAGLAAGGRVERLVRRSVDRGLIDDAEALWRLSVTTNVDDLASAGLVIEAVPEDVELKRATLESIADVVPADTVIATNTSSISVDELARSLTHPERVLGLHFFNPVPVSKLVEVVLGVQTSPELRGRAEDWVRQLGKTPITVRNAPGFASSRLGVAIGLEAIRMVEENVASPEDIDAAMTLGYGFPLGPLQLTDLVGLDVRLGIAQYLERELGARFAPPQLMLDMVQRGDLGRKAGRGFYEWDADR